jgi:hypothetical protein
MGVLMARRYGSGNLGVLWFLPGRKRPIGTTTVATSNLIGLLAEDGLTFAEAHAEIRFDQDATDILQVYIDHGYGDARMSDLGVRA